MQSQILNLQEQYLQFEDIVQTYSKEVETFEKNFETKIKELKCYIYLNMITSIKLFAIKTILLLYTQASFLHILNYVRKLFNLPEPNQSEIDCEEYLYYLQLKHCFKIEQTKRFSDDKIIQRMNIRLECYKEGWSDLQVEKYISKYILRDKYDILNQDAFHSLINNICLKCQINRKQSITKIGRPKLPIQVKQYMEVYHKMKVKENINKTYKESKEYKQIKNILFTKEEVETLCSLVNNDNLCEKIKKLQCK